MPIETSPSAASTQISLEEYLHTSYRPDCDFVDGQVEERNVGETKHGLLQVEVAFWFRSHKSEWNIRVITELRTRVGRTRVRIPDVSVAYDDEAIKEQVRTTPPLIAIEILSPEDRLNRIIIRLQDYLAMGVQNLWVLDPMERVAYIYTSAGLKLVETTRLTVSNSSIYLDLPEIFSALD
jgi:Uma2 family endonuclease